MKQDLERIKKVLSNLLSNSIKYSHKGTIKIIVQQKTTHDGRKSFNVKVCDQGIGIKDPSKIGQMFKQLEIKDGVQQNGIGFGLTISKMIMEKLGGSLEI